MILQPMPTGLFLASMLSLPIGAIVMIIRFVPEMEDLWKSVTRFQRVWPEEEFRKRYINIWIGNVCVSSIISIIMYIAVIMSIYYCIV